MPAVIQRSFTPEGAMFATTQWAAREDDLFHGDSWKWIDGPEGAAVFADILQAEKQAAALREPGVWVWAAVRAAVPVVDREHRAVTPAEDGRLPFVDCKVTNRRGVSPGEMARGDVPARIRAAALNRKVATERTAEDWRRVYEATCARMGEHDDE